MTSTKGLAAKFAIIVLVNCRVLASPPDSEKPQRGGTLKVGVMVDWRSLDPARAFDADSAPLQKLLFRGLIDFDDGIGLVPDQASDWNISPDGKVYTFHLRPGVRFSNGREVEAEDYVFSFERMLDAKTSSTGQTYLLGILGAPEFNQGKAAHVAGLHAPDPRTFVIELKEPQFTFRYVLAMNFCDVLPRDVVQKYGDDFQYHLTGSGPYYIKDWRRNISYQFERNPYYTGKDGYVDAVHLFIGGDTTLTGMMLQRGELDWARSSLPDYVRFKRDPKLRSWMQLVDTANTDYFFMNTEVKPFDNIQVRRAISHAIDPERMAKLAGEYNLPSHEIVPPAMPWSNPGLPRYDYNPGKARAMLREAGYPDGFKTDLWYILSREDDGRVAQGIQEELRAIGVRIEIHQASYIAFQLKAEARKEVPCGIWGWMEDYPDASDFLDVLFNGERITDTDCNNTAFYNNPVVNRLIDQGNASNDVGERTRFYKDAERMIMTDAPWVPILHERVPMMKHSRLHGTTEHPVWLWRYQYMWLDQSEKSKEVGG
jgi:ABC-type transport system substrate-binding protein